MCRIPKLSCLAVLALLAACQPVTTVRQPPRVEAPVGGPERVFTRPVTELVPPLQNARRAGPNGRVGSELVFWGYELASQQPAFLVACAVLPDVDCAARLPRVCRQGNPEILFSQQNEGEVRSRSCQAIGVAHPGDRVPNCDETEKVQPVEVTLLACR